MKKIKLLRAQDIISNHLQDILSEEAKKGWFLKKITQSFLIFYKDKPHHLKYQVDYIIPSSEYKTILNELGYEFVDNFKDLYIYKNEDLEAENLHTDEQTRIEALKRFYLIGHPIFGVIAFFLAYFIIYSLYLPLSFEPHVLGTFFINFTHYLVIGIFFNVFFTNLMNYISLFLLNRSLKRLPYDKNPHLSGYKWAKNIGIVLSIPFYILIMMIFVDLFIRNPLRMLVICVMIILFFIFYHFISKTVYRESSETKRKLLTISVIIVHLVCISFISELDVFVDTSTTLRPYMQDSYYTIGVEKNMFFTEYYSYIDDEENLVSIKQETYRSYLNEWIAKECFQYEVISFEQMSRMPSEEEMDQIMENEEEGRSLDIPYYSYEKAIKNMKSYSHPLVDACYYNNKVFIAIKGNKVLTCYMENEDHYIDNVIEYYF